MASNALALKPSQRFRSYEADFAGYTLLYLFAVAEYFLVVFTATDNSAPLLLPV